MSEDDDELSFDLEAVSHADIAANVRTLAEIGDSLRRMHANEDFNADGVRTIWHRARQRTELLTWENNVGTILKQEMTFYDVVVEFRDGEDVRTGEVPHGERMSMSSMPTSRTLDMHGDTNSKVLDYCSSLLRQVTHRDFYTQHMLKAVHQGIAKAGRKEATAARTSRFKKVTESWPVRTYETRRQRRQHLTLIAVAVGVAVVGGLTIWLVT